tara:strand:+ start:415 stop:627 length:213 start_codon:yes stop_codon:yes gene_type:complete
MELTLNVNHVWIWFSCFGMMFAILTFSNELGLYKNTPLYLKGCLAIILGSILYYFLPPPADQSVFKKENV